MEHSKDLNFKEGKLSALFACIQLSENEKLKRKILGIGNKSIVLVQKGKFAIRLFPQLAYTISKEKCEEDYYKYEIDLPIIKQGINEKACQSSIGFKTKGEQTIEFWESALGYNDSESKTKSQDNDCLDDSGIMLWRPYFQLTNASGSPIGEEFTHINGSLEEMLKAMTPDNTAKDILNGLLDTIDGAEDKPRIASQSATVHCSVTLKDGNIVKYSKTEAGVILGAELHTDVSKTHGRPFIALSEAQLRKIVNV